MRRLPEGGTGHDESVHRLQVPLQAHEFGGQPVEQGGVGGPLAPRPEILRATHEAGAEMVLPELVDRDAGGERILRTDNPPRQGKAVGRDALRQLAEDFRQGR